MDAASKTNNVEGSMDMKKNLQSRYGWICVAIATLTVSSSGCKSAGFSMPGKSMFGWNRQPDAATLVGNTNVPNLPESPAAKYDPAAIASKSGSPGKPADSAYGYGGTATAAAGGGSAQPGGAAMANGYQSGPYPMASTAPTPATTASSTATTGALPSPYGGTYNGTIAGLNTPSTAAASGDVPLPSSVAAALGKASGVTSGYSTPTMSAGGLPPLPNASAVGYTSNAPTNAATTAYQLPGSPASAQTPAFTASNSYTASAAGSMAGGVTGSSGPGLPALPGVNPAQTPAVGQAGSAATPPSSSGATPSTYPSANAAAGSTLPLLR